MKAWQKNALFIISLFAVGAVMAYLRFKANS